MVLQTAIKFYESLGKIISRRSNYLLYHPETSNLKLKALNVRYNIKNSIVNAKLMTLEMLKMGQYSTSRFS